jgi:hypothetical protein
VARRARRRARPARRTANKQLILLGAILERAVKHYGLVRNPAKDVTKLRVR